MQGVPEFRAITVNKLYQPPQGWDKEAETNKSIHPEADVWMLGVIFGQLICMEALDEKGQTPMDVRKNLKIRSLRPPLFDVDEEKQVPEMIRSWWVYCFKSCGSIAFYVARCHARIMHTECMQKSKHNRSARTQHASPSLCLR